MPIFSSFLRHPFPLPLISLFFFFGQLRSCSGLAECLLASHLLIRLQAGGDITNHRAASPCIEVTWGQPSNMTTGPPNQLGLGGTNHCSMGVAGHIKPHRVTDVKHHLGSHVWTRQIQIHVDHNLWLNSNKIYEGFFCDNCVLCYMVKNVPVLKTGLTPAVKNYLILIWTTSQQEGLQQLFLSFINLSIGFPN